MPGAIEDAITELAPLVQVSAATQVEIHAFRERYDRLGRDAPLPPKSLREMHAGRRRWLNLQARLGTLAKRFEPLAESNAAPVGGPLARYQGLSVSFAAALTLYDNYLALLTIIKDDRLRRLLFHPAYGFGIEEAEFWNLVDGLHSTRARKLLRQLLEAWTEADEALHPTDETSAQLRRVIKSSVSYRYARESSLADQLPTKSGIRRTKFVDALSEMGEQALGAISEVFGNGIGLVEVREGKLWKDEQTRRHLLGVMQPLDLLLEKTPFRLSDYFIPGHFGHVALWMGTDAELSALDLWSQAGMQSEQLSGYRNEIQSGRSVLEALRTGVELNTLDRFLNVDDVAVLRPNRLTSREIAESLVRGFRQVGKEYDFAFDLETTDAIVCSELPYHVYPGVDWGTDSQLGRFTISPDQVARQALVDTRAFDLIVFYHDGRLVEESLSLARMEALMREA